MKRVKNFSIEEIEKEIKDLVLKRRSSQYHLLDGFHKIKLTSHRYKLFLTQGYTCVSCKLKATHWGYDVNNDENDLSKGHLNLYANKDDKEVLFTKDHILPKSKGGKDKQENYQVMCSPCNARKGNQA